MSWEKVSLYKGDMIFETKENYEQIKTIHGNKTEKLVPCIWISFVLVFVCWRVTLQTLLSICLLVSLIAYFLVWDI